VRTNIGARISAERKAKQLSQADLERRCGLARCRISWLEHGRAVPTIETLERIADALEVPAYRLLYDGDDPAQSANLPDKLPINGDTRRSRRNGARLVREVRKQMSRMREEDQYLLLFIARKMAGRAPRHSRAGGRHTGRERDGAMTAERTKGNS
jgi:transcriptional regulator with XRE-family HTH domain